MSLVEVLRGRVGQLESRQQELKAAVSDPERVGKPDFPGLLRELGSLQKVLGPWREYTALADEIEETREFAEGDDEEMKELAEAELPAMEERFAVIESEILDRVLEDDPDADKPALIEIRAGAGGDEAALFARDIATFYQKFAAIRGWQVEMMDVSESEMGGFKEIVLKFTGEDAFRLMR